MMDKNHTKQHNGDKKNMNLINSQLLLPKQWGKNTENEKILADIHVIYFALGFLQKHLVHIHSIWWPDLQVCLRLRV